MCLFHYWLAPHNLIVLIVEMMGVVQVSLVTIYASSLGHNWVKSFLKKYALSHRGILIQIFNIDLQFSVLCAVRAPNNPNKPCTFISLGKLGRFAPREIISTQYVRVLSFDHQIGIGSIVGRNSSWCNTKIRQFTI